jgi:hypothetical protein
MGSRLTLQRLVIEFKGSELVLRCLYRRSLEDAPGPSTKRREREVAELTREGLSSALEALDAGDVAICGTSGFSQRQDILLATISQDAAEKLVKKGA